MIFRHTIELGLLWILIAAMVGCENDGNGNDNRSSALAGLTIRHSGNPDGTSGDLSDVIWSEIAKGYVAVGAVMGTVDMVVNSPDGVNWTQTDQTTGSGMGAVTECPFIGKLLAVGYWGDVTSSGDGTHWQSAGEIGQASMAADIACSGNRAVVVGETEDSLPMIASSSDGSTWQIQTVPGAGVLEGIEWTGTLFVAVGREGTLLTSATGDSWTAHNTDMPDNTLRSIATNGEQMVVVGDSGAVLASTDMTGTVWTDRTPKEGRVHFGDVVWANDAFVIASIFDNVVVSTVSGSSYSTAQIEANGMINGLTSHNGQVVVVCTDGSIFSTAPR